MVMMTTKADEHAAEELELGVDSSGPDVVLGREVVAAEHGVLKDIDAADEEPSEGDDERHDETMAEGAFESGGKVGSGREHDEQAGNEEDGAGGVAEIPLHASPLQGSGFRLFAAQYAKQDVMHNVREDDDGTEQKDSEEPGVTEMEPGDDDGVWHG